MSYRTIYYWQTYERKVYHIREACQTNSLDVEPIKRLLVMAQSAARLPEGLNDGREPDP
jgi:hypothetical protein